MADCDPITESRICCQFSQAAAASEGTAGSGSTSGPVVPTALDDEADAAAAKVAPLVSSDFGDSTGVDVSGCTSLRTPPSEAAAEVDWALTACISRSSS